MSGEITQDGEKLVLLPESNNSLTFVSLPTILTMGDCVSVGVGFAKYSFVHAYVSEMRTYCVE